MGDPIQVLNNRNQNKQIDIKEREKLEEGVKEFFQSKLPEVNREFALNILECNKDTQLQQTKQLGYVSTRLDRYYKHVSGEWDAAHKRRADTFDTYERAKNSWSISRSLSELCGYPTLQELKQKMDAEASRCDQIGTHKDKLFFAIRDFKVELGEAEKEDRRMRIGWVNVSATSGLIKEQENIYKGEARELGSSILRSRACHFRARDILKREDLNLPEDILREAGIKR